MAFTGKNLPKSEKETDESSVPKKGNKKGNSAKTEGDGMLSEIDKMFEVSAFDNVNIIGKTGFDVIDAITSPEKNNLGIVLRTLITSYGNSGSGKSTLLTQIGGNLVNDSEEGFFIYYDGEKTMSLQRLRTLGVDVDNPDKFKMVKKNTTVENFFRLLQVLAKKRRLDLEKYGEEYIMKNPYVVIVDSFSALASEREIEADTEYNQAMGTSARAYSALWKKYVGHHIVTGKQIGRAHV